VLAAVVLTVCCAQRQATSTTVDLSKLADVSGQRLHDSRLVDQQHRKRRSQHRLIRPAAMVGSGQAREAFGKDDVPPSAVPDAPVVHSIYPPSRFRLPPPAILA
jgi:hypothetical protein